MSKDLCIPVYLNEKIVFDLLAILEDGFSKVRAVTDDKSSNNRESNARGASFNTSNMLSTFLGISLNGDRSKEKVEGGTTTISEERVHTSASLFSKLRNLLYEDGRLKVIGEVENKDVLEGDFVEMDGFLNKSPMVETLDTFIEVFSTFMKFAPTPELGNKKNKQREKNENELVFDQMKLLLDDLTKNNTLDLIIENKEQNLKGILPVKMEYFVNNLESELLDGRYKVLGKVIRVVNENESVNLFRKSSFKIFQDSFLNEFVGTMNESLGSDDSTEGINMPNIISKLEGPVLVFIPIALYI
ncbi:hypothetical protein QUF55_04360 [Clostridiaceae bacterium HSG29]|nr:hypothetical protein [Clostridiaceae bacterium HSG29]